MRIQIVPAPPVRARRVRAVRFAVALGRPVVMPRAAVPAPDAPALDKIIAVLERPDAPFYSIAGAASRIGPEAKR